MASSTEYKCPVDCVVGIKEFKKSSTKRPLEERLEQEDVKQSITEKMDKNYNPSGATKKKVNIQNGTKKPTRNIYVVGQDIATESITKLTNDLLSREYLNVANFDGTNDADVGVIVIPETHIPKKPRVVEPDNAEIVIQENPNNKKYL